MRFFKQFISWQESPIKKFKEEEVEIIEIRRIGEKRIGEGEEKEGAGDKELIINDED